MIHPDFELYFYPKANTFCKGVRGAETGQVEVGNPEHAASRHKPE